MSDVTAQDRATAERLAREVYEKFRATRNGNWTPFDDDTRDILVEMFNHGLTHRDRTAEREAARKAWDAAIEAARQWDVPRSFGVSMERERDKFLAAEFDAGERVTLSNGEAVRFDGKVRYRGLTWDTIAGFLQRDNERGYVLTDAEIAALYRLAEQRGAER